MGGGEWTKLGDENSGEDSVYYIIGRYSIRRWVYDVAFDISSRLVRRWQFRYLCL